MSTRQVFSRKDTEEKPIQSIRGEKGAWYVRSFSHKQLWYKVVLDSKSNPPKIACACEAWKYGGGALCKHMFAVMRLEGVVGNV